MISNSPFPWWDTIICKLSEYNSKFRKHYLKDIFIERTNICKICLRKGLTNFHHIIPRVDIGKHCRYNLIELCPSCHRKAESGLIYVGEGKYFEWGVKKYNKIKRKLAMTNMNEREFYNRHLKIDATIKTLINTKHVPDRLERINEYMKSVCICKSS